jgi:hypothetical protein
MLKGQRVGGPEVKGLRSGGWDLDGRTEGSGLGIRWSTCWGPGKEVRSALGLRGSGLDW